MNCHACQLALQRHLDLGAIPDEDGPELALHLAACPECAGRLAAGRLLLEGLRKTPAPRPPAGLAERVVVALRKERQSPRRSLLRRAAPLAAAASSVASFMRQL